MRITPAEFALKDIQRMQVKNQFNETTLLEKLAYDNKRFENIVLERIYNQRAFLQSIKAKGTRVDMYI
jgi:hypothetical protein